MIGVLHPDSGNLTSVRDACARLGRPCEILRKPADLEGVGQIVLPGQGRFGAVMEYLRRRQWVDPLRRWIADDKPLFAICVGMQALFEESEEDPGVPGLGVMSGRVTRLQSPKRPMMGWANVHWRRDGYPQGAAYFVNGFVVADCEEAVAYTEYGARFCAAAARGSLFAAQFHPEKSGAWGKELMDRCLIS